MLKKVFVTDANERDPKILPNIVHAFDKTIVHSTFQISINNNCDIEQNPLCLCNNGINNMLNYPRVTCIGTICKFLFDRCIKKL